MLRSPATHFLILGAALYAVQSMAGAGVPVPPVERDRGAIVVDADDLERMRRSYEQSIGGVPDEAAYRYMIEHFAEEEALYREALALGLDRADQTVRWRLIEKMQYLGEADANDPADQVFERALALGLQRDDTIVRNVLIDKYRMLVRYAHGKEGPTEAELRAHYERNEARFANPSRASFLHVFFSAQKRGQDAQADAERALARLRSAPMPDDEALALGDVFLAGHRVTNRTAQGIGRLFGDEFASTVLTVDEGEWAGPFQSAYGQHLVLSSARSGGGTLPFESVRSQVARAAEHELREARLQAKIAELRDRYQVVIRADRDDDDA